MADTNHHPDPVTRGAIAALQQLARLCCDVARRLEAGPAPPPAVARLLLAAGKAWSGLERISRPVPLLEGR